jgi:tRNA(fMet)-specific endonuclease VapC
MIYLLDTDICIYILKKKPETVYQRLEKIPIENIHISVVTQAELLYGAEKSTQKLKNMIVLADFFAYVSILPWTSEAASSYGHLRAALEKKGTPIGNLDLMIVAHALSYKAKLITNNQKHFEKVPHLKFETWG